LAGRDVRGCGKLATKITKSANIYQYPATLDRRGIERSWILTVKNKHQKEQPAENALPF
jgi:hypothetical protein